MAATTIIAAIIATTATTTAVTQVRAITSAANAWPPIIAAIACPTTASTG